MQMQDTSLMIRPDSRPVTIQAPGAALAGRLFLPPGRPRVAVVLHGATGVPQSFYAPFATWLAAERGFACLTYDYRDFGASARSAMRRSKATMADWGLRDQTAALAALAVRLPDADLWVIGHSLGGAMLPYQTGLDRVSRAILVGAGMVHVSDHPWPYQALARLFWQGHGPLVLRPDGHGLARIGHPGPVARQNAVLGSQIIA